MKPRITFILISILICQLTSYSQISSLVETRISDEIVSLVPSNWDIIDAPDRGFEFAMMLTDSSADYNDHITFVISEKLEGMSLKGFSELIAGEFLKSVGDTSSVQLKGDEGSELFTLTVDLEITVEKKTIPLKGITYFLENETYFFQYSYLGRTESYKNQKSLIHQMLESIL